MIKKIEVLEKLSSVVSIPGSKSIANRALIIAALADGVSILKNFPSAEDCEIMIEALKSYGVEIHRDKENVRVHGNLKNLRAPEKHINTGNAGTVMRFLSGFSALAEGTTVLTGNNRMLERPIAGLAQALKNLGVDISTNNGFPPVRVRGRKFKGGKTAVDAKESSQYISAILLSAPCAEQSVEIFAKNTIPSISYIDLTLEVMRFFGIDVKTGDNYSYFVNSGQHYKPAIYIIEGDYSSASYFILAALIMKGKILLSNLNPESKQPDRKFLEIIKNMGCKIIFNQQGVLIDARGAELNPLDVDANDFPDLVPALAVLALFLDGVSKIRNVKHLRYKETDRLNAISTELTKLGAGVNELEDGLVISPSRIYKGTEIETYSDHRIAMSFAVAGLKIGGLGIKNPDCVNKSFPEFWYEFEKLYRYQSL